MYPTIVVVAYKRPRSLRRLLRALTNAEYPNVNINLLISIDYSNNVEVHHIARQFVWLYGTKRVLAHNTHLGLKAHILSCGALSAEYGAIIVLEDDLLVSKYYYTYACQALDFYAADEAIAGISLYHYAVSENGFFPFYPIDNGTDVYFMQIASSWGQAWTARQWDLFNTWFAQHTSLEEATVTIPDYLQSWSDSSWKKHFIHYLIATHRYFVFPRYALSTNFADSGTNASTKALYQVPIQQLGKKYLFENLANSYARYDAHFEMEADSLQQLVPPLQAYNFTNDIYGTKRLSEINTPYMLTTRHSTDYVRAYGLKMLPNIANVLYEVVGKDIVLAPITAVHPTPTPLYKHYYPIQLIAGSVFESLQAQATVSIISCVKQLDTNSLRSLQSVIEQDYAHIEHIIIDITGCTRAAKMLNNKSNIRFIRPKGALLSTALQEALQTCKGQIVGILPTTAYYTPTSIARAVNIFSTFKKVSCFNSAIHKKQLQYPQQMRYTKASKKAAPAIETLFWRTYISKNIVLNTTSTEQMLMQEISQYLLSQTNVYTLVQQMACNAHDVPKYTLWKNWRSCVQIPSATKYRLLKAVISWCSYPFYHYNIPILQYPYIDLNAYPSLIKYNQSENCFYLSAY